jgi:hypothetical protein
MRRTTSIPENNAEAHNRQPIKNLFFMLPVIVAILLVAHVLFDYEIFLT